MIRLSPACLLPGSKARILVALAGDRRRRLAELVEVRAISATQSRCMDDLARRAIRVKIGTNSMSRRHENGKIPLSGLLEIDLSRSDDDAMDAWSLSRRHRGGAHLVGATA